MITVSSNRYVFNESCAAKEPDFNRITDLIDEYELTERRKKQIDALVAQLFPAEQ